MFAMSDRSRRGQAGEDDPILAARAEIERAGTAPPPRSASLRSSETPGLVIDRYTLVEEIGEGGFGTVWLAEQKLSLIHI